MPFVCNCIKLSFECSYFSSAWQMTITTVVGEKQGPSLNRKIRSPFCQLYKWPWVCFLLGCLQKESSYACKYSWKDQFLEIFLTQHTWVLGFLVLFWMDQSWMPPKLNREKTNKILGLQLMALNRDLKKENSRLWGLILAIFGDIK